MDIRPIATQRFMNIVNEIKSSQGLDYKEINAQLELSEGFIHNINSRDKTSQKRYVGTRELYALWKHFKGNPMYILNISEKKYIDGEIKDASIDQLQEKIKLLEKAIEDKDQIINLQKQLISNVANKSQKKLNT